MTVEEFDDKYKDCLEEGHYGLAIENPYVITLLDLLFSEWSKDPEFTYSQIKTKFGTSRVYLSAKYAEKAALLEILIDKIMKDKFIIVEWPEVQKYMEKDGFNDNAFLINDESWLDQYGSSSYFIKESWKYKIDEKFYSQSPDKLQ